MAKRLAIITTHPIQYNAPLFQLLQKRGTIQVKVFYTWGEAVLKYKFDPGFKQRIEWDIPLLAGYEHAFMENVAREPGSHHFNGIDNPGLITAIETWKADALLVYGWNYKSHLRAMRHFKGKVPVLFRGDSTFLQTVSPVKKLLRIIFLRWVYRHIDTALYVGTHNKAYFCNVGVSENQLVFAPHAIDNERFVTMAAKAGEQAVLWRGKLGITPEAMVFLYAGKLDKNKNITTLAAAFLNAKVPGAHLVIAGNGTEEGGLKSCFAAAKQIHFLPFQNQSQMPVLYELCDVFVLPSNAETWGLSINEAMACGKAILASSGCGAAIDLVKEGKNGYTFNRKDPKDLVNKIRLMVKGNNHPGTMGICSRELINAWSFPAICEAIEALVPTQQPNHSS